MTTALTDAEIRERVHEEGNRDPDELVVMPRSTNRTRYVYHDNDDPCHDFEERGYRAGPERVTRREARERGYAPCAQCLISESPQTDHDLELYRVATHFDPAEHDSIADARADLQEVSE